MTVSSTTNKGQYTGNGSNKIFAYPFKILNANDVRVIATTISTGEDTVQTIDTHYSVSGVGDDAGGSITFITAPASTVRITVVPVLSSTQEEDYIENGPFLANAHETALDRQALISQKLEERIGRAVTVPAGTLSSFDMELPTPTGNESKFIRVNAAGTGLEFAEGGSGGSGGGIASIDGVSNSGGNIDLIAGTNMTITPDDAANTITFAAALTTGFDSLNSIDNPGGNIDIVAGTAMSVTADDGANTVTVGFNPSGLTDNSISGDKVDGGTISNFTSTGIDDNATSEVIDLTDSRILVQNTFRIENTAPIFAIKDTDAAADEKTYRLENSAGVFSVKAFNDAEGSSTSPIVIDRTGTTIDEIELNATTFDLNGALDLSGAATLGGDVTCSSSGFVKLPSGNTAARPGSPVNGQIRYNSQTNKFEGYENGGWTNVIAGAGSVALDDLTDVTITTPAHGAVLLYSTTTGSWYDDTIGAGVSDIDDLTDVSITGASNGQVLTYNSGTSQWVNSSPGTLTSALDGLTDVAATSPTKGDIIMWDGTNWTKTATKFNVKAYGATGDGSTDDYTAINSAITALLASTYGGVLYFPAGKYRVLTSFTVAISDAAKSFVVEGDSEELSQISFEGVNGFNITFISGTGGHYSGNRSKLGFSKISLETNANGSYKAIIMSNSGNAAPNPVKMIERVVFSGAANTNYWSRCIDLYNTSFVTIMNNKLQGDADNAPWNGIGIYIDGDKNPVDIFIKGNHFWQIGTGIEVVGTTEGIYTENNAFVGVATGIYWHTTAQEPLLVVKNSHINATDYCIRMVNVDQANITGNLLYANENRTSSWVGISLSDSNTNVGCIITSNIVQTLGSLPYSTNGIVVDSDSHLIAHNIVNDVDTGIWLQSNSANNTVLDNVVTNFNTYNIYDQGTNNTKRLPSSSSTQRGALVNRTSAQSINNSTWTTVQFNATQYDTSSLFGSSTRMTVPSGVTKVKVSANVSWSASSSGQRQVTIRKNGTSFGASSSSAYAGQPSQGMPGSYNMNVVSPVLVVTSGDYFEVEVFQDSGGALDVAHTNTKNANITWFCMEIVE